MKSPIAKDATILGMKNSPKMHPGRWGILLGPAIGYVLLLTALEPIIGPTATLLLSLPVGAITWEFGLFWGLAAGLIGVVLNSIYLVIVANFNFTALLNFGVIPGTLILAAMIFIVSILRKRMEEYFRLGTESQSREKYFALLNDMTNKILLTRDFDSTLRSMAEDMAKLIDADDCYITRWDEARQMTIPVSTTAALKTPYAESTASAGSLSMTASVMKAGRTLVAEDVFNSPYMSAEIAQKYPARSIMGVPLMARENKLGVAIIAFNTPHRFTSEEVERAEHAAHNIAVALINTRQDVELTSRLHESDAFAKIAVALSETEQIGLSSVLQLILVFAKDLIQGTEQAVIHLLDAERNYLIPEALIGYENSEEGKRKMRLGEGIAGQAVVSGEAINIPDVYEDPRFIRLNPNSKIRSLIVVPIRRGEDTLGTISVQSSVPNIFSQHEKSLLSRLGTQVSIAIENAHLLEDTQQALKETNALYRINQGLVALNPDELLEDVVDLFQNNLGFYHVQVYIVDEETGDFFLRASSGEAGHKLIEQNHSLRAGSGIVGYVLETSAPFYTNNVDDVVFFNKNPLLLDIKCEMAVPVKIGEKIVGVLDIQQTSEQRAFSNNDLHLVTAVADQLSIALQKANLYNDLQTSLQHEKEARNQLIQNERLAIMGRLLATVSHELNNPLQAIQNALFLLKDEKGISEQGMQDLEIVLAESERMANLIERLRTTYRPIHDEDFQPTQINNVISEVHQLVAPHLRSKNVQLVFNPDPQLPSIPALSAQVRQVALNLVMNAVDAMTDGGVITVETKMLQDVDEAFMAVSDTGEGIDPSILPNIFEAFITNKQSGTGIGLTISHDIIIKHNGRITAENNPDKGATFKVWLPAHSKEAIQ